MAFDLRNSHQLAGEDDPVQGKENEAGTKCVGWVRSKGGAVGILMRCVENAKCVLPGPEVKRIS